MQHRLTNRHRAQFFCALTLLATALFLPGCSSDPGPLDPQGHRDTGRFITLEVIPTWQSTLKELTQRVVAHELPVPKSAIFQPKIRFTAYYDSLLQTTHAAVYGNVDSVGAYGQDIHQGFYVIWEQPGNVAADNSAAFFNEKRWQLFQVNMLDNQF